MQTIDLTNCDREPIHIPGKIQSHGFLVAVTKDFVICFCSENVASFLPTTAATLLNQPISELDIHLQKIEIPDFLKNLITLCQTSRGFELLNPYSLAIKDSPFNLIMSMAGEYFVLEFEPDVSNLNLDVERAIGSSLSQMLADSNMDLLLSKAAGQVKNIIGYDRVMIYKFHDDGHGEVVAEMKNDDLEPWIGLHYPATDIPKQARDLYKINLVRIIANVDTAPSAIATYNTLSADVLDLTHSSLRAVSPIHIQYLKNMGVASSFSISLLHYGELWGLIACHNYTPRFINYKERSVAKLIGQVLSSALSYRQSSEEETKDHRFKAAIDTLNNQLLRYHNIADALFKHQITLLNAVEAGGAALLYDKKIYTTGITPDDSEIAQLVAWLNENMESPIYATHSLSAAYPAAMAYTKQTSGILACKLSNEPGEYMIWFRPEKISTIAWAGNPDKPVEPNEDGLMLISPRKSFATWTQTVQHTSAPWVNKDTDSALHLKDGIMLAISFKATELKAMNEKLQKAYDELDTFSHTISHDLKNPLTTIKSFSQLLQRNFKLEPRAVFMVDRILASADKMDGMIDNILNYSRIDKAKTTYEQIDMDKMLNDIKEELTAGDNHEKLLITIQNTPDIYGDETMVMQVFSNLVGNAVKYSSRSAIPSVHINGTATDSTIQYSIRDNGIGIKPADHEKIYDLFTRSDDVNNYEGSGVGLSIVKRIMEKHKGSIRLESDGKNGSVFFVEFDSTLM